MADGPSDWHAWLAANPPPDIQALCVTFGGYSSIPPWAWEDWDRRWQEWEGARRTRLLGSRTWEMMAGWKAKKARRKKATTAKEQKPRPKRWLEKIKD